MEEDEAQDAGTDELQRLVEGLGRTVRRTLAESASVAECLGRIRHRGYEVSLVVEATVGAGRSGRPPSDAPPGFDFRVEGGEPAPVPLTPLDRKFLRSLKISVDGEE